jgi:hypothetical protein
LRTLTALFLGSSHEAWLRYRAGDGDGSWTASCRSQRERSRGSRASRDLEDAHLQGRWRPRGGRNDAGSWDAAIVVAKCFEKESRTRIISYHRVSSKMSPSGESGRDVGGGRCWMMLRSGGVHKFPRSEPLNDARLTRLNFPCKTVSR